MFTGRCDCNEDISEFYGNYVEELCSKGSFSSAGKVKTAIAAFVKVPEVFPEVFTIALNQSSFARLHRNLIRQLYVIRLRHVA